MKSKMLKSEDVLKVIKTLKSVLPQASSEDHLNMTCCWVNYGYSGKLGSYDCGTVHCHGGWYAIAASKNLRSKCVDYRVGATLMARHLGKSSHFALTNWAHKNPIIWGNNYGRYMFQSNFAFMSKKRPFGARSLKDIVNHWKGVYERVLATELEEKKQKLLSVPPINDLINTALSSAKPIKKSIKEKV